MSWDGNKRAMRHTRYWWRAGLPHTSYWGGWRHPGCSHTVPAACRVPFASPSSPFGVKQWLGSGSPDVVPMGVPAAWWSCGVSALVAAMLGGHLSSPSALISVGRGRRSCRGTPGAPGQAGTHLEHGDARMRKVRLTPCSLLGALQKGTFPLAVPHWEPPSPQAPRGHPAPLAPRLAFRSQGSAENGVPLGDVGPFPHTLDSHWEVRDTSPPLPEPGQGCAERGGTSSPFPAQAEGGRGARRGRVPSQSPESCQREGFESRWLSYFLPL